MNLDPRGYGVCRILYAGARKFTGEPISTHAAKGLIANIKKGEKVFILTGFVLHPWNEAETDGIISSCVFARFLMRAFDAKPVMIVPEQCKKAIKAIGNVLYFKTTDDIDNIEAPGRNKNGYYHNAVGVNTSDLEAKFDILFMRCQKLGIFNLSIGDLGNEIGMAAIEDHIRKYVPYAELGGCKAGTGFGILASSAADNIITATVSDWGCDALMAATAFLIGKPQLLHNEEDQSAAMDAAAAVGMLDMYGEPRPYIDGIGKSINIPMLSMMKALIEYPATVEDKTDDWFKNTIKKGFFTE